MLVLAACSDRATVSPASPTLANVRLVRIDFHYMGWGVEQESFTLVPARNGSSFILLGRSSGGAKVQGTESRVSRQAMEELLAATYAPDWSRERGVRAVASVLKHRGVTAIQPSAGSSDTCTPGQLRRLARNYVNRKGIVSLTDDHYGQGRSWTDDYPSIQLAIQFRDGPPLRMYSDSQKAMMLPWHRGIPIESAPGSDQNWSLALSRALQEVLPKGSAAYQRLGIDHEWHFRSEIERVAEQECRKFKREDRLR